MVLPDLLKTIHLHADELAAELMADLRSNPRTKYLRGVGPEEFRRRALDLYANLSTWIAGRREEDVASVYEELGAARCAEGVSASELAWALSLAKTHLLEFIRRNDAVTTSVELYQLGELMEMVERFFDRAVYHSLRGYEGMRGDYGRVQEPSAGVWCD
jgi:hypothetical protein